MIARDDMKDAARWVACGIAVLVAHGGVAFAVANWKDAAAEDPAAGMVVELAALPQAPEATPDPPAPVETEKAEEQPEKPVEETVEAKAEIMPEEPPPPELKPEPPPVKEPEVVMPVPPRVVTKPPPKKEKKPPAPVTAKPRTDSTRVAALSAAPRQDLPSSSNASAKADWYARVVGQIRRSTSAPPGGEHGTASVSFTITRSGSLVAASLSRSSGSGRLDSESVSIVRRAAPYPPPPPDVAGGSFPFTVPIRFQ